MIYDVRHANPTTPARTMFKDEPLIFAAINDFCLSFVGLEEFLNNIIAKYSLAIFYRDEPVVKKLFRETFCNYYAHTNMGVFPHKKLANVVTDLLGRIAGSLCLIIIDPESGDRWTYTHPEPFSKWITAKDSAVFKIEIQLNPFEQKSVDYLILVPEKIKFYIRKFDHENAIVGRNTDTVF